MRRRSSSRVCVCELKGVAHGRRLFCRSTPPPYIHISDVQLLSEYRIRELPNHNCFFRSTYSLISFIQICLVQRHVFFFKTQVPFCNSFQVCACVCYRSFPAFFFDSFFPLFSLSLSPAPDMTRSPSHSPLLV